MAQGTRWLGVLCLFTVLAAAQDSQRQRSMVRVDPEVLGSVREEVTLRCRRSPSTEDNNNVNKVSWSREVNGHMQEVAVFSPGHRPYYPLEPAIERLYFKSPSPYQDAALIIRNTSLTDEGLYQCTFITSNRTERAQTRLILTVTPQNSAEAVPVLSCTTEMVVAICTAANGKPPAKILWETDLYYNVNNTEINNTDGTVTVHSQLRMKPSIQVNGQTATCVISQEKATVTASLTIVLSIRGPNGTSNDAAISLRPAWGSGVSVWVSVGLLGFMVLICLTIMFAVSQRSGSSQTDDMYLETKQNTELEVGCTQL